MSTHGDGGKGSGRRKEDASKVRDNWDLIFGAKNKKAPVTEYLFKEVKPMEFDYEGDDDMPAHIKSSLFGCELTIPISNGRLALGTWQGIYLCEHRDYPHQRNIILTLNS